MPRRLVLVTGASGAVGPRIVDALLAAGFAVRTLSRHAPAASDPYSGSVDAVVGDVTAPDAARKASRDVDTVVHLAGLLHGSASRRFDPAAYERVNVTGTATMIAAASAARVRRFILASTVAVYGPSHGGVVNEASPTAPETPYAQSKLAAERLVLEAADGAGRHVGVVLRLAAVYGGGVKGHYRRLVTALARHRFVALGRGRNRRTLVYDRDAARAVLLAIDHPSAAGNIFNVTDGQLHSVAQIVGEICDAIGRRPPRVHMPLAPVRTSARLADLIVGRVRRGDGLSALIDKYLEDVAVSGQRIQQDLGFRPRYDLRAGWREAVAEMRQRGAI
jgi:nucleoside-diphosphate-sugar epimerase